MILSYIKVVYKVSQAKVDQRYLKLRLRRYFVSISCVKAVSEMPEVQAISEAFCVSVVLGCCI